MDHVAGDKNAVRSHKGGTHTHGRTAASVGAEPGLAGHGDGVVLYKNVASNDGDAPEAAVA